MTWMTQFDESMMVLMDMLAAALKMFSLVTAFYRVRKTVVRSRPPKNLNRFILIKKSVAVSLCGVLLCLQWTTEFNGVWEFWRLR